jgi:hypothetical protein
MLLHHVGQHLRLKCEYQTENQRRKEKAAQGGIEYFSFILYLVETEIGRFHAVRKNDIQESCRCKEYGNIAEISSMKAVQKYRGEKVTDEPSKYIAQAKPKGLVRKLFDSSQNITVWTNIRVLPPQC